MPPPNRIYYLSRSGSDNPSQGTEWASAWETFEFAIDQINGMPPDEPVVLIFGPGVWNVGGSFPLNPITRGNLTISGAAGTAATMDGISTTTIDLRVYSQVIALEIGNGTSSVYNTVCLANLAIFGSEQGVLRDRSEYEHTLVVTNCKLDSLDSFCVDWRGRGESSFFLRASTLQGRASTGGLMQLINGWTSISDSQLITDAEVTPLLVSSERGKLLRVSNTLFSNRNGATAPVPLVMLGGEGAAPEFANCAFEYPTSTGGGVRDVECLGVSQSMAVWLYGCRFNVLDSLPPSLVAKKTNGDASVTFYLDSACSAPTTLACAIGSDIAVVRLGVLLSAP
jgi:hypothetical protein